MLKVLIPIVPIVFLFLSQRHAAAGPATTLAVGMLVWYLEKDNPPRLLLWASLAGAAIVAVTKGAGMLLPAILLPPMILAALEWTTRRRRLEDPTSGALLLTMLIAAVVAFGFTRVGNPFRSLGEVRRIVAIGDSLTAGVPGDGVGTRWPDLVARSLGGEAVNLSYPGDTIGEAIGRWESTLRSRSYGPTPAWQPDLFIVVLGGNDIRRGAGPTNVRNDLLRLRDMIPADIPVLYVAVPGAIAGDQYRDVWREAAAARPIDSFMNQETLRTIFTSPAMTVDQIHFNARGNEYFAQRVVERIRGG